MVIIITKKNILFIINIIIYIYIKKSVTDDNSLVLNQGEAPINSEQFSDIFTVYTAKRFPGMTGKIKIYKN